MKSIAILASVFTLLALPVLDDSTRDRNGAPTLVRPGHAKWVSAPRPTAEAAGPGESARPSATRVNRNRPTGGEGGGGARGARTRGG